MLYDESYNRKMPWFLRAHIHEAQLHLSRTWAGLSFSCFFTIPPNDLFIWLSIQTLSLKDILVFQSVHP